MKKQLNIKKLILLNLPYILMGLFSTNFGEAWRMAVGADASAKMLSFFSTLPVALASWWPSLHPLDLLVGLCCCGGLRLAVYLKSKNAKKYRHGMEYGSARWGTHEDITPYIDPVFQNNVILTKTESLTMNSRPKDPKTARNKNVLVIGGSGSGKTRFWLKPNLMQMHSSYVVTDPKGTILVECGKMLQRGAPKLGKDGKPMKDKHGKVIYEPYRIKVLNTINFKKSMHYNPFAYIHSEKDILKLVTTLIANTKGEGKAGDDFWVKAETLLYCALIGYIHYEAPVEEQNFSTLIEFIYNFCLAGNGPTKIARMLTEQQIPTPGTLEYRRTGSTRRYHPGYECKWATNTVVHVPVMPSIQLSSYREGGKRTCPSISSDKNGFKRTHHIKPYQNCLANFLNPLRMLSRTRPGSTPSAWAISFGVMPR